MEQRPTTLVRIIGDSAQTIEEAHRLGAETKFRCRRALTSLDEARKRIAQARQAISTSMARLGGASQRRAAPATTAPIASRRRSPRRWSPPRDALHQRAIEFLPARTSPTRRARRLATSAAFRRVIPSISG